MTMSIINEPPPIYDEIVAAFKLDGHRPIFSWGNCIYNPHSVDLSKDHQLIAHEEMHGFRQLGRPPSNSEMTPDEIRKIMLWWKDYIESKSFRLEEEIPAHRAEYRQLLRMHGSDRPTRRRLLASTAKRLRNPIYDYNHLFNFEQAKAFLSLDETEWR